jgi:multimeric flavodoxin WrbA
MKALVMNGADDGSFQTIETALLRELEAKGFTVTALQMREMEIDTCVGCFGCWVKTPGECVINDAGRDVAREMVQSDMLVYLTPVTFGGYSYHIKKAVDRFIPVLLPYFKVVKGEIHHPHRYEKRPRLVTCGVLDEPDAEQEQIFFKLNLRNALNMDPPSHSAGIVYLNQDKEILSDKIRRMLDSLEVKSA